MKNKLRILPLFALGGTLVQHRSPQNGNLLASFYVGFVPPHGGGMEVD